MRLEGLCYAWKGSATLERALLRLEGLRYDRKYATTPEKNVLQRWKDTATMQGHRDALKASATLEGCLRHSKDACDARTLSVNTLDSSLDAANALG